MRCCLTWSRPNRIHCPKQPSFLSQRSCSDSGSRKQCCRNPPDCQPKEILPDRTDCSPLYSDRRRTGFQTGRRDCRLPQTAYCWKKAAPLGDDSIHVIKGIFALGSTAAERQGKQQTDTKHPNQYFIFHTLPFSEQIYHISTFPPKRWKNPDLQKISSLILNVSEEFRNRISKKI